jgi:CHAT domain-containing protein/tetratricopeptide (TPR) repeat protein
MRSNVFNKKLAAFSFVAFLSFISLAFYWQTNAQTFSYDSLPETFSQEVERFISQGDYDQARALYEKAILNLDNYDTATQINLLIGLGRTFVLLRQFDRARQPLEEALQLQSQGDDKDKERQILSLLSLLEAMSKARDSFAQGELPSLAIPEDDSDAAGVLGNAYAAFLNDDYETTAKLLDVLLRLLPRNTLQGQGKALVLEGVRDQLRNDLDSARHAYGEALDIAHKLSDPEMEKFALSFLSFSYLQAGDYEQALVLTKQAIEAQERVRDLQVLAASKSSLLSSAAALYKIGVWLAMQNGQEEEAFALSEAIRARTFLDQLGSPPSHVLESSSGSLLTETKQLAQRLVGLEQERRDQYKGQREPDERQLDLLSAQIHETQQAYDESLERLRLLDPEYASLVTIPTINVDEVQALLEEDQTLVSYFISMDVSYAFVITVNQLHVVKLEVTEFSVSQWVTAFRGNGNVSGSFGSVRPEDTMISQLPLEDLHSQLIQPLLDLNLLTTEHLIIIPNSILHSLPFAALWDEKSKQYLGEQYTLSYLPSASVLPFLEQKSSNNPNEGRLLAMANARAEGFARLDSATQEAVDTASFYSTTAYLDQAATETRFKLEAPGKDIILLSAHGELNEETPLFSRIVLADDDQGQNDGSLTVQEIYELDLSEANLVVLSACETNGGQLTRGDDLIGLSRAFIYAGAPSIVASLWKVNDEATRLLVTNFFSRYYQGKSAAEALRLAQAEVRSKPEYAHPYYWAGVVLIGMK